MTTMTAQATQVYQLFIKASPEQIWDAITKPEFTSKYFYGTAVDSTFEPAAALKLNGPDGSAMVEGEILEVDPPRRLQHSWRSLFDPEQAVEPYSRLTWEIEPQEDGTTLLTVVHDQLDDSPKTAESVSNGWMLVLSGLKTLLETGKPIAG
jgi:uncharacterized protein YndB with AHSA1/START domain